MREVDLIVVHHSASPPWTKVWDIKRWHRQRGWSDIGYHVIIEAAGNMMPGRSFELPGAHALGHNENSLGICVTGDNVRVRETNDPKLSWSRQQQEALRLYLKAMRYMRPGITIVGHYELNPDSECPGKAMLENVLKGV